MRILAAAAFIAIFVFHVPFPLIVLAAGVIGFLGARSDLPAFDDLRGSCGRQRRRWSEPARRRAPGACPAECPASAEDLVDLARALARPGLGARGAARCQQCVQPDRRVLFQNGGRDLRRGLCRARICRAASGRSLRLAATRRNVRRARHGGDDARAADYGAAVRWLHGCLSRPRHAVAARGCRRSAACSPHGSRSRRAFSGYFSALPSSS